MPLSKISLRTAGNDRGVSQAARTRPRGGGASAVRIRAAAPAAWWADLAGAAAILSVVIVVALWLTNRGLQNMAGPAEWRPARAG